MRHRSVTRQRRIASIGVIAIIAAGCGGDDDQLGEAPTTATSEPTGSIVVESVPSSSSTVVATTSQETSTGTVIASGGATVPPPPPNPTAAPPPPQDTTVDAAALALIEAGLYSVPGADVHCDVGESGVRLVYAFPAAGGDLYTICAGSSGAGDSHRLTIRAPGGATVTDLEVRVTDQFGTHQIAGRDARDVVVRGASGGQRVLGVVFDAGGAQLYEIPIFLPHGRPPGTWTFGFDDGSAAAEVLAPCANGSAGVGDPTVIDPRIRFVRSGPVDFEHCRRFPEVVGLSIGDARATIVGHYRTQGVEVRVEPLTDIGCGNATVANSSTPPRTVNASAINSGETFERLDVALDCPEVPGVTGRSFDEIGGLLDDLAGQFQHFSWTADPSCVSGTSVAEQTPAAGTFATQLTLVRCA